MKQGTVKFSKEFRTLSGNVWLGIENEYDMNTENPIDVFRRAEEAVQQYAKASGLIIQFETGDYVASTIPVVNKSEQDREVGITTESILSSPDMKVLETYRWLIKGKPELERAYILRHDQLTSNAE